MRLGWLTDPHFNFVNLSVWDEFATGLVASKLDGLLITGDISEAEDFDWQIQRLSNSIAVPIYFVLGNHDFYHGSLSDVRKKANRLSENSIHYLQDSGPHTLDDSWALCGVDGWADGRVGDYFRSSVRMHDFQLIEDLRDLDGQLRLRRLRREGTLAAVKLYEQLDRAVKSAANVVVATHVPPFRESCWYNGMHSDDDWAPFFVCGAVGWMLKRFSLLYPDHRFLVLCGHTHHAGKSQLARNVWTWTGAAEYGNPQLSDIIEFDRNPFEARLDYCP